MSKLPSSAIFTLRDLNRQPARVLAAVRKFGSAEVRTRAGEVFTVAVKAEPPSKPSKKRLPDFQARWEKLRQSGNVSPEKDQNTLIDQILAGE